MAAAPESASWPTAPLAVVLAAVAVSIKHPCPMTSRSLRASGPAARRWRAAGAPLKKSVEKVVTTLV